MCVILLVYLLDRVTKLILLNNLKLHEVHAPFLLHKPAHHDLLLPSASSPCPTICKLFTSNSNQTRKACVSTSMCVRVDFVILCMCCVLL